MMMQEKVRQQNHSKLQIKPMFHLQNISLSYGHFSALKNIDFVIQPKEVWFLTGASGAGKTSLMNVLGGFLKPQVGRVILPRDNYAEVFTTHIFQDLKVFQQQSIENNLWMSFDKKIYETRDLFFKELVELAKYLGVYEHLDKKIAECNGGLKQKVAILRALLSRPDVVLADEPTSSLDREAAYRIFDLFQHYNQRRSVTIVWASHNQELTKQFSGKMAHLEAGKLVYSGHACFI